MNKQKNVPATRAWFLWGERKLTVWQRVRLLLGARLYVRFNAPSGQCSAACDFNHQVTRSKIGSVAWPDDLADLDNGDTTIIEDNPTKP